MRIDVKLEELGPVKRRLDVEIPREDVAKEIESAYKRLNGKVKVKGFRKGKVPRKVLEGLYSDRIKGDVASKLVSESLSKAIKDSNISPVSTPEIEPNDFDEGKGFSYSAIVEVRPQFDVSGYEELDIKINDVDVTEEEIQAELDALREKHAHFEAVKEERPVKKGDSITIDLVGTMNGAPIKDGSAKDYPVIVGSGNLFPLFEEGILGMKKGEEKLIEVDFPDDYNDKNVAGGKGLFTVTLKEIKEKVYPEMDDDFARDLSMENLNDLREKIKEGIKYRKEEIEKKRVRDEVFDSLLEKNQFDVPPKLLEEHTKNLVQQELERLYHEGKTPAQGLEKELHVEFREKAEKDIRLNILVNAIAEKGSVSIDDKDMEDYIMTLAGQYGQDPEHLKSFYKEKGLLGALRLELLTDKTFDFIRSKTV